MLPDNSTTSHSALNSGVKLKDLHLGRSNNISHIVIISPTGYFSGILESAGFVFLIGACTDVFCGKVL